MNIIIQGDRGITKLNGLHKSVPKMVVESVFVIELGVSPVIQVVDVSEEVGHTAIPKHDGNEVPLVAVWGGRANNTDLQDWCTLNMCCASPQPHTSPTPPHPC